MIMQYFMTAVTVMILAAGMSGLAAESGNCETPLYRLAGKGDLSGMQRLLEKGISVNIRNGFCSDNLRTGGATPLFAAISEKRTEAVKFLIDKGADVNADFGGRGCPVLHFAAASNPDIVEYMLRNGADMKRLGMTDYVDGVKHGGEIHNGNAFHYSVEHTGFYTFLGGNSAYRNFFAITETFIKFGADINAARLDDGYTPLHIAVDYDNIELVKLLVSHGADLNIAAKDGRTPYCIALTRSGGMRSYLRSIGANTGGPCADEYSSMKLNEFAGNAGRMFKLSIVPLCYAGISVWAYEREYKNDRQRNPFGVVNGYAITVAVVTAGSAAFGYWITPSSGSGFLGGYDKFYGLITGAVIGIPVGMAIAYFSHIGSYAKHNRAIYYAAPAAVLTIPIFAFSTKF